MSEQREFIEWLKDRKMYNECSSSAIMHQMQIVWDEAREELAQTKDLLAHAETDRDLAIKQRDEARELHLAEHQECVDALSKLDDTEEELAQAREKYAQVNKDLGFELRDPNGTIWEECARLQTEMEAQKAQAEVLESIKRALHQYSGLSIFSDADGKVIGYSLGYKTTMDYPVEAQGETTNKEDKL